MTSGNPVLSKELIVAKCILAGWILLSVPAQPSAFAANSYKCLPAGISGSDVVTVLEAKAGDKAPRTVSVNRKLRELKAHCRRGKLVDGRGREIYFFKLEGCWGNPPENYQEVLAEQARKIAELKKRYTVIEMTCNSSGELIQ